MRFILVALLTMLCVSFTGCSALGITPPPTNGRTPYQDMLAEKNKDKDKNNTQDTGIDNQDADSQVSVPEGTNQADFNGMTPPEDFLGSSSEEENSSEPEESSEEESSNENSSHKKPPVFVDKYNIGNTSNSDHDAEKFSDAEKFVRRLTLSDVDDIAYRLQLTQLAHDLNSRDGFYDGSHLSSVDTFNYFIGLNEKRTYTLEREYRYRGEQYHYMIPVDDIVKFIDNDFQWEEFDVGTEEFTEYMQDNGILLNIDKLYLKEWPVLPEVTAKYKLYKSVPLTFNKVRLIFQAIEYESGVDLQTSGNTELALPDGSDTIVDSDVVSEVEGAANTTGDSRDDAEGSKFESGSEVGNSDSDTQDSISGVEDTKSSSSVSEGTHSANSEYKYYPVLEIELSTMDDYKFLEFWTNRN